MSWRVDRRRAAIFALAGIVALCIFLRVVNLKSRTIWYDEAYSILFSQSEMSTEGGAADVHPLLYYEALHLWMRAFGNNIAAARLFSALLGILTVFAVFGLGRDWFGSHTGLLAALITAVAPFHVQYSQEARMYALLTLGLVSTTWLYWRAYISGKLVAWIAFALLAALNMYTQQLAAFYLLALGLLPVLFRDWRQMKHTVLAGAAAFALYLPWFVHLPGQLDKLQRYWVERPNILHIWLALRSFITVNLDFEATWWLPTFFLAALLPALLFYRVTHKLRQPGTASLERRALIWAVWLAFAPIGFMWIASVAFQPVFLPRALLPSAVIMYMALAWVFVRGAMPRVVTAIVIAAWVPVIVFGWWTHYRWDTFPNPPFDRAADFLQDAVIESDVVLHGNKITALPLRTYAPRLPQTYVRDVPGSGSDTLAVPTQRALRWLASACPAEAARGAERVWYVAFEQFDEEMADAAATDPDAAQVDSGAWLRVHYSEQESHRFNDLVVTLFTDPDPVARRAACADAGGG